MTCLKRGFDMITYEDILKSINEKLRHVFPTINIPSKDIEEGFDRPSFYVEFDNIKASDLMNYYKEKTLYTTIYYFPPDRYKNQQNVLATLAQLEDAFLSEPLAIGSNLLINIIESESNIIDGVLQFGFEIYAIEENDNHDADQNQDLMEELEIII